MSAAAMRDIRIMFLNQSPRKPTGAPEHHESPEVERLLNSYASPGTRVELASPDDYEGAQIFLKIGAQSRLNGLHHALEVPSIVRKIVWAAENGYDAVIQSNTFDPGVEPGRLAVGIPVIGLMRTALHLASTLADRIGITVPLETHLPHTRRIIRSYGMSDFVCGLRPLGIYGDDLLQRKDEIFDGMVKLIRSLVSESGAEIVLPLGGAIIPYVVDPADLARATGIQVLNTKAIGIRHAETCVRLGLIHSPLAYPRGDLNLQDFIRTAYAQE